MVRILVAAALLFSTTLGAQSNGSMGSEVKIIVVNPSRSIQVFDELRQVRKNEKAQIKDQIKQNKVIQRVEEKARKDATKAYEKKLKAQRKARLK